MEDQGDWRADLLAVMHSPSVRLLLRSYTFARRRRPSTYIPSHRYRERQKQTNMRYGCRRRKETDKAIRLMAIKDKLKQQRQHIEDLDKHMSVPTRHHPPSTSFSYLHTSPHHNPPPNLTITFAIPHTNRY